MLLDSDLARPERRHWLPIERVFATWDAAAESLSQTDLLVSLAEGLRPEGMGALGFRMLSAPTLDVALTHLTADFELVTNSGYWQRVSCSQGVRFVWHRVPRSAGQALSNEAIFCHFVRLASSVAVTPVQPLEVTFQHSAQWSRHSLRRVLFAPVRWGERQNTILLPRPCLDAVPRLANAGLARYFEGIVSERLALVRGREGLVEQLRSELMSRESLGRECLLEASQRLAMPARTLQRRLERQRTSFSQELDRVRRDRGFQLVVTTRKPFACIARELGLADATVFSRSFRRWYGETPGELRRFYQK